MVGPRVTRKKKRKPQKKVKKSKKCSQNSQKKKNTKKGVHPHKRNTAYQYSAYKVQTAYQNLYPAYQYFRTNSGARKEPAELIPPNKNKRNIRTRLKRPGRDKTGSGQPDVKNRFLKELVPALDHEGIRVRVVFWMMAKNMRD